MVNEKCIVIGCEEQRKAPNAKYCEKHSEEQKKLAWRRSKQKNRMQTIEVGSTAYWRNMDKLFPNQPRPTQIDKDEEIIKLLLQIRKTNNAILKELKKSKKK